MFRHPVAPALDLPAPLRALLEAGRATAGRSRSARVAAGRLRGVVEPELVPAAIRPDVRRLIERAYAATAKPLPARDFAKALPRELRAELGDIDDQPLAVRPHAQVHRAELRGRPVAVKLARPGLAQAVRSDLSLLDALAAPAGAAFPGADIAALVRELRERVLDELDLEHEAQGHRRAARGLRSVDGVSAADVLTEHCSPEVLVCELAEGPTLEEELPPAADRRAVARALVRVYLGAPRAIGLALANPRASDVAWRPGGEIVLLNLGAGREVHAGRLEEATGALQALRDHDADGFAAALGGMGVLGDERARAAHRHAWELIGDLLSGPAPLSYAVLAERGERALDRAGELLAIGAAAHPSPLDVWPARGVGQLVALLARLEVQEDWGALALDALREGW